MSDNLVVTSLVVDIKVLHCLVLLPEQLVVVVSDCPVLSHDQFQTVPESSVEVIIPSKGYSWGMAVICIAAC